MSGTQSSNWAWMQIDTAQAGGQIAPVVYAGAVAEASTGNDYRSASVSKAYFLYPGSYTFRIEGNAYSGNDVGASTAVYRADLTATYYAGPYGSVAGTVARAAGFEHARAVSTVDVQTGVEKTAYRVDLRELEVRAARARAEAERAERELLEERARQGIMETERPPDAGWASSAADGRNEPK